MPRVLPFAGVRYTAPAPDLDRLLSPPYDVISPSEQLALRALSPHNAVYVELPSDAEGQPGSRYRLAAERLAGWRRAGVVGTDRPPTYYLSETRFAYAGESVQRRDVFAALGVEPWSSDTVRPHEHTMAAPKADRLDLLRATHLNASSIWVLHRERLTALDAAWAAAARRSPTAEFNWRGERHRLWLVDDQSSCAAIQAAFAASGPLYIADGHHRYETSLAFRAEAGEAVPGAAATLATLTWADEPGLLVLPTHRLLAGLDPSVTLEVAAERWRDLFQVTTYPVSVGDPTPAQIDALVDELASRAHSAPSLGLYGLGRPDVFSVLQLRGGRAATDAMPADHSEAWKSLDVSRLHALIVDPLIAEMNRPREDVLSFTRDPHEAFSTVRAGRAAAAFLLNPTPVSGVLGVADAHDRMPEKSTYFYPKPPAGLVMRDLGERS